MKPEEDSASVIAAAPKGEPAALGTLRGWLGADPSQSDPHIFAVTGNNALHDSLALGPKLRNDAFTRISRFVPEWPQKPDYWSSSAPIAGIHKCPPLSKHLMGKAIGLLSELDIRLLIDEQRSSSDRARIRKQMKELTAPGHPPWENWIRQTPPIAYVQFDRIISAWMNQSVDHKEAQWFTPAARYYDVVGASRFFNRMHSSVREFLGVRLADPESAKSVYQTEECVVFSSISIREANRRAKLLELNLRFKAV